MRRLAAACYHHRKLVLIAWVVLLVGLFGLNKAVGGEFRDEFKLPGSESQDGFDLLQEQGFGNQSGFSGQIVFKSDGGVDQPQVQAGMEQLFAQMTDQIPDTEITSPYSEEGQRQVAQRGPNAGNIAFATIDLAERDSQQFTDAGETARHLVDQADVPGTEIELGGDIFAEPPEFASEGVGLLAAVIILLVAFGSVLAMGLPIITALFGIATGISVVGLIVNVINMPSFSNQAVAMVAIGVGIDYALFIVTRYREGLQSGSDPERSTVRALDTAGRAVLFAGITVIIAVLGLFTIGLSMVRGLAVGIAVGVLMTMLASLTLLPAMLGFVGTQHRQAGPAAPASQGGQGSPVGLVPVEPRHPAPALARPGPQHLAPAPARDTGARHPHGVQRRQQPADVGHHPRGLRPRGRRLRSRLQRTVPAGDRHPRTARPTWPRSASCPRPSAGPTASPPSRRRARTRPAPPRCSRSSRPPHRRTRTPSRWCTPCATTSSPASPTAPTST